MTATPQPVQQGRCPVCHRVRPLTAKGLLRNHAASGLGGMRWCPGTGREAAR